MILRIQAPADTGAAAVKSLRYPEGTNKQIIPLLRRPAREGQPMAEAIAERNWIFFDDDARFDASMQELLQTLDTDLDWVKDHTRLLVRAKEWTDGGGDRSRLLRGKDLRTAEDWLAHGDVYPQAPPTSGQRAFIAASRRAADHVAWLQRTVLAVGLVIAIGWPRSLSLNSIRRYSNATRRSTTRPWPRASSPAALTRSSRPSSAWPPTACSPDRTWPRGC
jgi:hypothetical protein